jgi:hypothetical protein
MNRLRANAKSRGYRLEATKEEIWALFLSQKERCSLTNVPLALSARGTTTASLDRIDSSRGYTLDNLQWVHKVINLMKRDLPQSDFVLWCRRVAEAHDDAGPLPPFPKPKSPRKRKRPPGRPKRL